MSDVKNDVSLKGIKSAASAVSVLAKKRADRAGSEIVYVVDGYVVSENTSGLQTKIGTSNSTWVVPKQRRWAHYCKMKRLRIFAGPNGSGKSILYESLLEKNHFHPCFYINADIIEADLNAGKEFPIPDSIDSGIFVKTLQESPFRKRGLTDPHTISVNLS